MNNYPKVEKIDFLLEQDMKYLLQELTQNK